jgi:hypothetical protein
MRLAPARLFAISAAMLLAPLGAAAFAADPAQQAPTSQQPEETPAETDDATDTKAPEEVAEDKRVCRYVKLDMSSRRKTKVCRTVEEWREINNPR